MLKNPFWINLGLRLKGWNAYRKLRLANTTPRVHSGLTLRKILLYAKDTEYGKEHNFADILTAPTEEELFRRYQANVPANNDYEAIRPYVEKHKEGTPDVLIPGKPVLYATTSGTTKEPKWVPISQKYLKNVYSQMTNVWLLNFVKHSRKTFAGKIVFVVGKTVEGYAPDGTPFGAVSGLVQQQASDFVKAMYASKPEIFEIKEYTSRCYTLMRMTIEQDVTLLIAPNPSTMLEMQGTVNENLDDMIADIEQGTINDKFPIECELKARLLSYLKPNPERAAELRRLKQQYGTVLPKHYWPNLQTLSTWKCGNTKVYVDRFQDFWPEGIFHQELGYFATECRFGLCIGDKYELNSVLFPHYHYYEFVEESELESENPRFYQIYELEEGKRYCSYVTTLSGLYRYNMNDLIEAGPKYRNTPTVHMVQKINGIVSLTGEKLHEQQFIKAVTEAQELTELKVKLYAGFAVSAESRYHFYYEFANQSVTQQQAETFTRVVDNMLQKHNIEYASKRDTNRLGEPKTFRLRNRSLRSFKALCLADGLRDGQFKFNLLMQDEKRQAKFNQLVIQDEPTEETKAE